jgi:hypothetical protein
MQGCRSCIFVKKTQGAVYKEWNDGTRQHCRGYVERYYG